LHLKFFIIIKDITAYIKCQTLYFEEENDCLTCRKENIGDVAASIARSTLFFNNFTELEITEGINRHL
jgi:hypothetical protein